MNVFKSSNRFDFLNDSSIQNDNKDMYSNKRNNFKEERNNLKEDRNFFKNDYPRRTTEKLNKYETKESKEKREQFEKMKKEKEEKFKEEENRKKLSQDNFPQLNVIASKKIEQEVEKKISYIEKVTQVSIKENKVAEVKPGWVEMKCHPSNPRKIIYTYGEGVSEDCFPNKPTYKTSKTTPEPQVLEALVNLYNKRTQEYIDMWGYDTWEKMYRFPNYDYEYFEKLDEEYEAQQEDDE
jgi:hypothetical protein